MDCCNSLDLSRWSVAELKTFLKVNNVSTADCFEKLDLVAKARELFASNPSLITNVVHAHSGVNVSSSEALFYDSIRVGSLQCNCVLIGMKATKEALLVDPGGDTNLIMEMIKKHDARISSILITHGHFDHFLAVASISKFCEHAPVRLAKEDIMLYRALAMQCGMVGIAAPEEALPEPEFFEDGQLFLNGHCKVIKTPGHSPGSSSFYFESCSLLLSGDTLFKGSVGRTDLFGGNMSELRNSIMNKLYVLPKATKVICGHGEPTTIGHEAQFNPIISLSKI